MICKHCEDKISGKDDCEICGKILADECLCCHKELSHGVIVNANIHIVGSSISMSVEKDPDAYAPSWKAGNNE
jgi:hypothetical protein